MGNELTYAGQRAKINREDPFVSIVRNNLESVIQNITEEDMIKNLKKYGKTYTLQSYRNVISRSTLDVRTYIKFMLAANKKEFTISISEEEMEEIYKELTRNEK